MLALAFDSSTPVGSIAVGRGDEVLAEASLSVRAAHSEMMLGAIGDLLESQELELGGLEALVVGAGPGSFTGLRIGAALAKGLCFARGLPLYAYPSLWAVVAGLPIEGSACAMFDARGDRVYWATFESVNPLRELRAPSVAGIGELLAELAPLDEWSFGGDGAARHAERIRAAGGRLLPPPGRGPRASGLLWLARERAGGRVENVLDWEPAYLLPPAAERARAAASTRAEPPHAFSASPAGGERRAPQS